MRVLKLFKKPVAIIAVIALALLLSVTVIAEAVQQQAAEFGGTAVSYQVTMKGYVNLLFIYDDVDGDMDAEDDYYKVEVDGGKVYKYPVSEVNGNNIIAVPLAPDEMAANVTVTPVRVEAGAETLSTKTATYSVKDYVRAVLADANNAQYHDAVRALLNWGAQSEAFYGQAGNTADGLFSRDTNPLAAVKADGITYPAHTVTTTDEAGGFTKTGSSMSLVLNEGNVSIHVYIKSTSEAATLNGTIERAGMAQTAVVARRQTKGDYAGTYLIKIDSITASLFDELYTITITEGENTFTTQVSVLEYLKKAIKGEADKADEGAEIKAARKATAQSLYQFYMLAADTDGDTVGVQSPAAALQETCNHGTTNNANTDYYWIAADAQSSYYKCSRCFAQLGDKAIDNGVEKYMSAELIEKYGSKQGGMDRELMNEGDMSFVRMDNFSIPNETSNWFGFNLISSGTDVTGSFAVMKVRMGRNGLLCNQLKFYATTLANQGISESSAAIIELFEDGDWHTILVDLKGRSTDQATHWANNTITFLQMRPLNGKQAAVATYKTNESGEYVDKDGNVLADQSDSKDAIAKRVPKTYSTVPAEDDYLDIAYFATCNSLDDIKNIIDEQEYEYSINEWDIVKIDVNTRTCSTHRLTASLVEYSGSTITYTCPDCSETAYTTTFPESVVAYIDAQKIASRYTAADKTGTEDMSKLLTSSTHFSMFREDFRYDKANNTPYFSFGMGSGGGTQAQLIWTRATAKVGSRSPHEEYKINVEDSTHLIVKMRVNDPANSSYISLYLGTKDSTTYDNKTNTGYTNARIPTAASNADEWTTYVIDLKEIYGDDYIADSATGDYVLDVFYLHAYSLNVNIDYDISYMAFVKGGWEGVKEAVDGNVIKVLNKTGGNALVDSETEKCVDECSVNKNAEKTAVEGGTKYVHRCTVCNDVVYEEVIPSSVTKFFSPVEYNEAAASYYINTGEYKLVHELVRGSSIHSHIYNDQPNGTAQVIFNRVKADSTDGNDGSAFSVGNAKWLVFRMRASRQDFDVNFILSTEAVSGRHANIRVPFKYAEAGEWATYVIDLSVVAAADFQKGEGTEYVVDTFYNHINGFVQNTDYFDVEYIAFVDGDWAAVDALVAETEVVNVTGSNEGHIVKTENGECAAEHATSKSAYTATPGTGEDAGYTIYGFTCSKCGKTVGVHKVPDSVSAYMSSYHIATTGRSETNPLLAYTIKVNVTDDLAWKYDAENDLPYFYHGQATSTAVEIIWAREFLNGNAVTGNQAAKIDVGQATHMVFKMRARNVPQSAYAYFQMSSTGAAVNAASGFNKTDLYIPLTASMETAEGSDWVTYVVDLRSILGDAVYSQVDGKYLIDHFYFHGQGVTSGASQFDFAYIAFVEQTGESIWTDIDALVEEETVVKINENVRESTGYRVYTATGSCVEHNFSADGSYKCTKCGFVPECNGVHVVDINDNEHYAAACEYCGFEGIERGTHTMVYNATAQRNECSVCGHVVVEKYIGPDQLLKGNISEKDLALTKMTENAGKANEISFVRYGSITKGTDTWAGVTYFANQTYESGQYAVIKYRLNTSANVTYMNTYTNAKASSMTADGYARIKVSDDNAWHVVVIDLAQRVNNNATWDKAAETYSVKYFQMRMFDGYFDKLDSDDYIDIAYIAMCNDIADIKSVVSETTYEWSASANSNIVRNTANNLCTSAHTPGSDSVEGNVHSIVCSLCGGNVVTKTIPEGITVYNSGVWFANDAAYYASGKGSLVLDGNTVYGAENTASSQIIWHRAQADMRPAEKSSQTTTTDVGNAQFMVIRAKASAATRAATLYYSTTGKNTTLIADKGHCLNEQPISYNATTNPNSINIGMSASTFYDPVAGRSFKMVHDGWTTNFYASYFNTDVDIDSNGTVDAAEKLLVTYTKDETTYYFDSTGKAVTTPVRAPEWSYYVYASNRTDSNNISNHLSSTVGKFYDELGNTFTFTAEKKVIYMGSHGAETNIYSYVEDGTRYYFAKDGSSVTTPSTFVNCLHSAALGAANNGMISIKIPVTTEWQTFVIDLSHLAEGYHVKVGDSYVVDTLYFNLSGAGLLNVEYLAFAENWDAVEALAGEGESESVTKITNKTGGTAEITSSGNCAAGCTLGEDYLTSEIEVYMNGTEAVYYYPCTVCGGIAEVVKRVPESVGYYMTAYDVAKDSNVASSINVVTEDTTPVALIDGGTTAEVIYCRTQADYKDTTNWKAAVGKSIDVGNSRYLVLKMRVDTTETDDLQLNISTTAANGDHANSKYGTGRVYFAKGGATISEWNVYVIDLETCFPERWTKANGEDSYVVDLLYFGGSSKSDYYIEYMAFAETWAGIDAIIDEDTVLLAATESADSSNNGIYKLETFQFVNTAVADMQ